MPPGPPSFNDGSNSEESGQHSHGGGSGSDSDDNTYNEDECRGKRKIPARPSGQPPDGEDGRGQNSYDGPSQSDHDGHASSPPNPCEEEGDNGGRNKNTMEIDASDLKNHPKANCIYQRLDQTKTRQSVIS